MHRHPHERPEKQPGVKKKQTFCGLNPLQWHLRAEVGVTDAGRRACRRSQKPAF
jgi:hypothetical protein